MLRESRLSMQELRDSLPGAGLPITGLCIVADPCNLPPGYSLIDKTHDKHEDADLWKDKFFGKRVTRYMCVENSLPEQGKDILVDMTVINEKDPVPAGYQCLELTKDTREKAQKKKQLCLRWMTSSLSQDAICEVMVMTRGRRPPNGYTLVGELSNLQLCFKMGPVPKPMSAASTTTTTGAGEQNHSLPPSYMSRPPTYSMDARMNGPPPVAAHLPYSVSPSQNQYATSSHQMSPPAERPSTASSQNPLSGIPWELNSKLSTDNSFRDSLILDVPFKSYSEIESQYSYKFIIERSAAARMPPELS